MDSVEVAEIRRLLRVSLAVVAAAMVAAGVALAGGTFRLFDADSPEVSAWDALPPVGEASVLAGLSLVLAGVVTAVGVVALLRPRPAADDSSPSGGPG